MILRLSAAGAGSVWGRGVAGACALLLAAAVLVAVPFERGDAAAASPVSAAGGVVSPASALTFNNRTTANGLGNDIVNGVFAVGSTVYAATGGGLSISTNGGATFNNRTTDDSLGSNLVLGVYAVGGTVYAATADGLSISPDGGATFINRDMNDGLGSGARWVYVVDDTVYVATGSALSISTNGGASFNGRTTANGLASDNVRVVYAVGTTVYAATQLGLSISSNGGTSFTSRTTDDSLGSNDVRGVYAIGTTVYAATTGGLSISTDGGATFTNYTASDGLGDDWVTGVFAVGGTVYAATRPLGGTGGVSVSGPSLPALVASPSASSVVVGAMPAGTVTISSTARPLLDDSAVTAVSATPGVATVTSTASPSGGSGNAMFTVTGVTAGTSNVTFSAPGYANVVVPVTVTAPSPGPGPGPPPVFPPSAPPSLSGVAGDGSAVLSWTALTSSGSFPISIYQAVVSPGGQSCLVAAPALTCTISGLTNGTAYTATVRALNGAGWGPYSTASAAFTPRPSMSPSITITGMRPEVRGKPGVVVTGTTTDFEMGAILRPWTRFPGQTSYTQGTASILVDDQGGFTWERRTGKTIYISIRSDDGTVESNRLILRRI